MATLEVAIERVGQLIAELSSKRWSLPLNSEEAIQLLHEISSLTALRRKLYTSEAPADLLNEIESGYSIGSDNITL